MVDDEDYEWLNQWSWRATKDTHNWYATRAVPKSERVDGKQGSIRMHRLITGTTDSYTEVDHQDRDTLNNQRSNLRLATHSQNQHNRSMNRNNKSGYKGVSWYKNREMWVAQIRVNGKSITLGYFNDPAKAGAVYDTAALELHGKFARTNNLDRPTCEVV